MSFRKVLEFLLLVPKKQDDITLLPEWEWVKAKHLRAGDVLWNGETVESLVNIYGVVKVYTHGYEGYRIDAGTKVKIKRRF